MEVRCRTFQSDSKSWESLYKEAAEFASTIERENLINVSVAGYGGVDGFALGSTGIIFVWYWY